MRLVTAAEMRAIDKWAIGKIGIPSMLLMENAGLKTLFTMEKVFQGLKGKRFTVVCGKGNNGGDGLVVARHLINHQVSVNVFVLSREDELSPDAELQVKILKNSGFQPVFMTILDDLDKLRVALEFSDIAIDAIYGTGFTGRVEGYAAEVVRIMNEAQARRVAIDIPTGLCATTGSLSDPHVRADITITLGLPKIGLYLYPGCEAAGEIWLADIGIPQAAVDAVPGDEFLLNHDLAKTLLPLRSENSHKGTFGHVLILAGSNEYQGAGVLASYGALRSGAGLVTLGMPAELADRMSCEVLPDVILRRFPSREGGFALESDLVREFSGSYRSIVAGPGWGRNRDRRASLLALLTTWAGGLVLDADALNLLDSTNDLASHSADLVLTPHLGEMSRLTGKKIGVLREDLVGSARDLAEQSQAVVVLKAAVTVIAAPGDRVFLLARPNSGLARGGSGDLLSGLIGGLMAQGLTGFQAAALGAFIHSEAGKIARDELGADAMTVSEVASVMPRAFRRLRGEEPLPQTIG